MAAYEFNKLKKKYRMFQQPIAVLRMADKDVGGKNGYPISDVEIDLTCGYEASVAGFSLYKVYNKQTDCFEVTDRLKKYIALGAKTEIALGYGSFAELLFVGVVTRVSYRYDADEIPCIRVSAMDVKGVMMAGTYVRQLTAASYSEAVKEILKRSAYAAMLSNGMIRGIQVTDTPDQSVPVPAEGGGRSLTAAWRWRRKAITNLLSGQPGATIMSFIQNAGSCCSGRRRRTRASAWK